LFIVIVVVVVVVVVMMMMMMMITSPLCVCEMRIVVYVLQWNLDW